MTIDAGTGMVFHGSLALGVTPISSLPSDNLLALANDASELLLKTVLSADERHEIDDGEALGHELRRQDLKISMILELLTTLMMQQNLLPGVREITFCTDKLSTQLDKPIVAGSLCQLSLYVDTRMPRPVQLFGMSVDGSEAGWQDFTLVGMSQCLRDALDKFIFRQHRRLVAAKIHKPSASDIPVPISSTP